MLIHFSSIYLSMHPYVLLILPHHLQSSHGFTSSSAPGNTETHAFRPVLSAFFFVTRIPDFAGRYKVTPQVLCCFNGVVRMWKKTLAKVGSLSFRSNKHFQVMTYSSSSYQNWLRFCASGASRDWIYPTFFKLRFPSIFCSNLMISKRSYMNLEKWSTYQRLLLNFLNIYPVYPNTETHWNFNNPSLHVF